MKTNKLKFFIAFTISVIIVLLLAFSHMHVRRIIFSFRTLDDFIPYKTDARILYKPGAEAFAQQIAQLLPEAIPQIEAEHYRSFIKPIKIYIFATENDYIKITGFKSPAHARPRGICFSPRIFKENRPINAYLLHELSHLHLLQQLGEYQCRETIPTWFFEGLATFTSNGGGAHLVTKEDAIESINAGKHFVPNSKGSLVFPKYGDTWKLKQHMFYRQSMLLVEYLKEKNAMGYRNLLLKLQDGNNFIKSFKDAFDDDLLNIWNNFLESIKNQKI